MDAENDKAMTWRIHVNTETWYRLPQESTWSSERSKTSSSKNYLVQFYQHRVACEENNPVHFSHKKKKWKASEQKEPNAISKTEGAKTRLLLPTVSPESSRRRGHTFIFYFYPCFLVFCFLSPLSVFFLSFFLVSPSFPWSFCPPFPLAFSLAPLLNLTFNRTTLTTLSNARSTVDQCWRSLL